MIDEMAVSSYLSAVKNKTYQFNPTFWEAYKTSNKFIP